MEIPILEQIPDKIRQSVIIIFLILNALSVCSLIPATARFLKQIPDKIRQSVISIVIFADALVAWQVIPDIFWKYLFFLRAPIFWGLLLITLPFIAIRLLPAMLRNLFVVRNPLKLFFVIVTANMAAIGIIINAYMIFNNSSNRFGKLDLPKIPDSWQYVLTSFWVLIILFFAIYPWLKEKTTENTQPSKSGVSVGLDGTTTTTTWIILTVIILITFTSILIAIKSFEIPELWLLLLGLTLSSPILFNCYLLTKKEESDLIKEEKLDRSPVFIVMTLFILVIGSVLIWGEEWILNNTDYYNFLVNAITFMAKITKGTPDGYLDKSNQLLEGHLLNIAFFLVSFFVYLVIGYLFKPQPKPRKQREAAALMYLMLIIMMIAPLSGNLTFFFDYYGIPVVVPFLLIVALMYGVWSVDHFFYLDNLKDDPANPNTKGIKEIIEKRLERQGEEKTLVVVCASGGGIQAAGWTVQVLTGLQEMLGESFTKAIGLISSVSGGSVGTMYYLDRFDDKGYPDPKVFEKIFNSATKDSLDAVGWGLAYPDLRRIAGHPFLVGKRRDRGQAIEKNWKRELEDPETSFSDWKKKIDKGAIPIPIFNATLVENGRRFLISPMTFHELEDKVEDKGKNKNVVDFNTLYRGKDIKIVTAARLSATFSYVTPICRNFGNNEKGNYHIADGGYFDNSGVVTTLELLNEWLKPSKGLKIKRVLLLQINAFSEPQDSNEQEKGIGGWWQVIIGPFLTLFKVRDTTQVSRVKSEVRLFQQRWKNEVENSVEIAYCPIFFPKNVEDEPPLSWKLTKKQKDHIQQGWEDIKEDIKKEIREQIRNNWRQWGFENPTNET